MINFDYFNEIHNSQIQVQRSFIFRLLVRLSI